MKSPGKLGLAGALALLNLMGIPAAASAADPALDWPALTSQTRPWVWWWWHGSAVDKTNLASELQRFQAAGLGGVQFTPIFGLKDGEARDIPYLTPAWLELMDHTVTTAHQLGLGVDMTLGTGWCFGGPTVSDADANASAVVKTFEVAPGGKLDEKFDRATTQALMAFSVKGKSIDLTGKLGADGSLNWTAPGGSWHVYAVSQKPSGQKVKRPAPGGEGWMLNPIYPQALRDWLPWFDRALAGYTGAKPGAVFQDSYEYRTDWSPDFFAQFEKLRGYKLQTELPALFGTNEDDRAARVKSDYRETVSDILATESEPVWIDWAHQHGFTATYQAHGTPGNWLDLYGEADVPETEMFHNDRSVLVSKFASSAAHTQGRNLTGAETGTWLVEHFTETLGELKGLADEMFLAGVNHVFYHGACYSPDSAPWPGWVFYASTEMNPRNSIWHDVPALNEYVARCQAVLQSGRPDNDILLYWPIADFWNDPAGRLLPMTVGQTGWFEDQPIGKTAHALWNQGYAFDYVSDRQLLAATVENGEIQMPGGAYKVIVVPPCVHLPLNTCRQLLALAQSGATVIFQNKLPADVPGWGDLKRRRADFKDAIAGFKRSQAGSILEQTKVGRGQAFVGNVEMALSLGGATREPMSDQGLFFVRRSIDGGAGYFIANRNATNFDGWVKLGRGAKSVVAMNALNGSVGVAASRQNAASATEVHLQLAAGESAILRALTNQVIAGAAWQYWQPAPNAQPQTLTGIWNVKFITGGPVLPAPESTTKLASWTTFGDTNAQSFAGTAQYDLTFDAPESAPPTGALDLGDVRQSARVKVNGKDYGTLITAPFRVVVDNLKPAGNQLEVEVTGVSANRIRDLDQRGVPWKIFKDINIVNINYKPFDAAAWPLTECGLLGPVTLTPLAPVTASH